jgi:hypothetical protein
MQKSLTVSGCSYAKYFVYILDFYNKRKRKVEHTEIN